MLALTWPVGIALTSWDYMWRSTALHRREIEERPGPAHEPPAVTGMVDREEIQGPEQGRGPLFHRRYRTEIRDAQLSAPELMAQIKRDLNAAAPTSFARFQKVFGDKGTLQVGDEFTVRMPGPWDGPVRVVAEDELSFRLVTLTGHLEAGQIEFRAVPGDPLGFEIESWARSGDRFADLLYHRARMAKEVQLHMWISFLEGVARVAGGTIVGGIDIDTRKVVAA